MFFLDHLELCVTALPGQCSPGWDCGGAGAAPSRAGAAVADAAHSELLC